MSALSDRNGPSRKFHYELPLNPKTYASCPVVSSANRSGLFEVVLRLNWLFFGVAVQVFPAPSAKDRSARTPPPRLPLSSRLRGNYPQTALWEIDPALSARCLSRLRSRNGVLGNRFSLIA